MVQSFPVQSCPKNVAKKLNAARGGRITTLYRGTLRDGMTRLDPLLPVALRSADWVHATELLEPTKPPAELKNLTALRASLLDYTRGMAALAPVSLGPIPSEAIILIN